MEEEAQSAHRIHVRFEITEGPVQFENVAIVENVMCRRRRDAGQMDHSNSHRKIWQIVVQQLSLVAGGLDERRIGKVFVESMWIDRQYHFISSITM